MDTIKLCRNCKHFKRMSLDDGLYYRDCCGLKTVASEIDFVSGNKTYYELDCIPVKMERRDSTGFFGLFKDHTRCGVEAKNFEPK